MDIVEAREEEILSNVAAQIRNSGYQDKLLAGIVISGAASNVKNLDKAASVRLHPDKTRFARIVPFALQAVHAEQVVKDGSLNTLLALMNEGNQNCGTQGRSEGGSARGGCRERKYRRLLPVLFR